MNDGPIQRGVEGVVQDRCFSLWPWEFSVVTKVSQDSANLTETRSLSSQLGLSSYWTSRISNSDKKPRLFSCNFPQTSERLRLRNRTFWIYNQIWLNVAITWSASTMTVVYLNTEALVYWKAAFAGQVLTFSFFVYVRESPCHGGFTWF